MKTTPAFPEPNYTQAPNTLWEMIPDMSDSELRVTLVMIRNTFGFHREEFKMGIHKLALAAGLSDNGAKSGAEAAEERGTFRRTNPNSQTEAEWELVVGQPVTPSASDPLVGHWLTHPGSASDPHSADQRKLKKEKKGDLIDGMKDLYQMPGAKKAVVKEYIESQIKVRMSLNPSGKDAESFLEYAATRKIKDGEDIDIFIDWWIRNFPARAYWSFAKMEQNWPGAFSSGSGIAVEIDDNGVPVTY